MPVTSAIASKIDAEISLNQIDEVIFAHQPEHMGSATMRVQTLLAIVKNHGIKIPVSEVGCIGLEAFNNENIMIVTTQEFTKNAKAKAPNAQHLAVDSLITTPEYDKMVARLNQ